MLGKLLKNDFIQTGRLFMWLVGIAVAGGGIGALVTIKQNISTGQFAIALIWNILLFVFALVLEVMGLVIILVSTNRSLFTERGYLTFSLPVSSMEMLFSKFAANVTFMLINIAAAGGLSYVVAMNVQRLARNASETLLGKFGMGDMVDGNSSSLADMGDMLGLPSFSDWVRFGAFMLLALLVFLILAMMIVLFVFTVSHVRPFQAKPSIWIPLFLLLTAVICFLAVKYIVMLTDKAFIATVPLTIMSETISLNLMKPALMLGLSAALFFLTNWLMSRKISLK